MRILFLLDALVLFSWTSLTSTRAWIVPPPSVKRRISSSSRLAHVQSITTAGLTPTEVRVLQDIIQDIHDVEMEQVQIRSQRAVPSAVPGATGRVVVVGVRQQEEEESRIDFSISLLHQWNEYLRRGTKNIHQPFLLSVKPQSAADPEKEDFDMTTLTTMIETLVKDYELRLPLAKLNNETAPIIDPCTIIPTLHYEVDGGKSVLVFDDLISEDLRQRLFNVVLGYDNDQDVWNDATDGPDPRRWVRGGLVDNLDSQSEQSQEQQSVGGNFGLTSHATHDICYHPHEALEEFESILSSLFPAVTLSRLDGNAFGEGHVTPLTANAPVHGDTYQPHIDADPLVLPPSPWTDIFGRYPNRSPGKPRLMSCLIYLNNEWNYQDWGGPTRIWDDNVTIDVEPKPGRIVLMDQDVWHSVVAPTRQAKRRPRYSLVYKLILHPNQKGQDMKESIRQATWPEPTRLSASVQSSNRS